MVEATVARHDDLPVLKGRPVYTRAHLIERHRIGLSTLEGLYRGRASNGHPDAVGKVGKALAWEADAWDTWHAGYASTDGLLTLEDIARRRGVSKATAIAWWGDHETSGHPQPVKKIGNTLYFDAAEHDRWDPPSHARRGSGNRAGDPHERITLAEFARINGISDSAAKGYANGRPPRGWPDPVHVETLASGRLRREYTRQQAWDYDGVRGRHGGGRPAGPKAARHYPYDGDPRLDIARQALRDTPPAEQARLPERLAEAHVDDHLTAPGTWGMILAAARKHPD